MFELSCFIPAQVHKPRKYTATIGLATVHRFGRLDIISGVGLKTNAFYVVVVVVVCEKKTDQPK